MHKFINWTIGQLTRWVRAWSSISFIFFSSFATSSWLRTSDMSPENPVHQRNSLVLHLIIIHVEEFCYGHSRVRHYCKKTAHCYTIIRRQWPFQRILRVYSLSRMHTSCHMQNFAPRQLSVSKLGAQINTVQQLLLLLLHVLYYFKM